MGIEPTSTSTSKKTIEMLFSRIWNSKTQMGSSQARLKRNKISKPQTRILSIYSSQTTIEIKVIFHDFYNKSIHVRFNCYNMSLYIYILTIIIWCYFTGFQFPNVSALEPLVTFQPQKPSTFSWARAHAAHAAHAAHPAHAAAPGSVLPSGRSTGWGAVKALAGASSVGEFPSCGDWNSGNPYDPHG